MDLTDLVNDLLSARTWTAFDIDDEGRVLAGHDDLGSVQLVEIAPDGTTTALTDLPSRCSGRYVPGRRQIIVQHDNGGDERMQLSMLGIDALPATPVGLDGLTALVHNPAYMHDLRDVSEHALVYSTNRRNGVDMDVVMRDLETGAEHTAYAGGGYVVGAAQDHAQRQLAVLRLSLQPNSTVVDLAQSAPTREADSESSTTTTTITDPGEQAFHDLPSWIDDDSAWLMGSNHGEDFAAIQRLDLTAQTWQVVVADESHDLASWVSPDGSAMLVGTLTDGAWTFALHDVDGTPRGDLDVPALAMISIHWSPSARHVVLSGSTPTEPGVIYTVDIAAGTVRQAASSARTLALDVRARLVEPTSHRIPARDGEQIPCFVYAPTTSEADADPLRGASVVHIHGGPESAASRNWHPVIQALAAAGLTVLVPNVRGSTGYGKRWYSLDDGDLRLESVADLADIHAWLPSQGLAPQRAALWGGSYGGYMVLAGVSMQPDLWAAGVDIVGMSSLVTFLENTSAYRRIYREREYGSLAEDRDLLQRASPITYLDQIVAPLFVIHGANDPRVPLSEAQQIHSALNDRGVPCELKVYRDEGHGLSKRVNKLDAYPAAIDFVRDHLSFAAGQASRDGGP